LAITGLTSYALNDQTIFTSSPQLSFGGLSFTVFGGQAYNIYYDNSDVGAYNCGLVGYCQVGPGSPGDIALNDPTVPITFSAVLAETPLPAALPLFAAGAGLMGLFGLQRSRRKAQRRAVAA
jgi:hypothetical protein